MTQFTLYTADCVGSLSNCIYPNKKVIADEESLINAVKYDHVTAEYKNSYRSKANFISADNVAYFCFGSRCGNCKNDAICHEL